MVSVIIPCYNYAHYLSEAVTSVINQTLQDFELIIVNDGSTDNTREVAESLIQKYTSHTITLINQQNSGQPAISRNNGISASRGLFIFCLDADDMIEPAMIEECLRLLESNSGIAIAYTDRLDFDGVEGVVQAGEYDFSRLIHANHISYCALYRREVWERVGGYRENVKAVEDWDFWIAAGALGYYGKRVPHPLFKYRRHDTGIFQEALKDFDRKHAQVIINNAALYAPALIAQAEKMLGTAVSASPLVSVIVPTFNRPDMLKDTIQSILDQTFQNFEIIVVNDAGQDVLSVIQTFNSLKISYLSHETNKGLAAARNTGISAARGKYIAYLDDDDIYYPEHLATLIQRLESDGSFVAYSDAHRVHLEERDGVMTEIGRDLPYSKEFDSLRILFENFIPVLCVMHRRECLELVESFDPLLHRLEDWDLWIRMSRHYQFNHVPTVTCAFSWRTSGGATMTSGNWEAFDWARLRISHKSRPLLPQIPAAAAWQAEFVDTASQRLIAALDSVLAARHYEPRALFGTNDLDEVRSSASRLRDQHPEHQVQMARLRERIENYAHLAPENGPGALQGGGRREADPAPLVSVIVPTFNRPETLRMALESILNQSFTDFEIVVVNDAGSEVDFVLEALPHQGRIVYLRHQMNRGLAAARNTGIGAARGKYIAYLDDDDIFYPDHLETLVHLLQANQHQVAYTDAYRALQRPEQGSYRTFEKKILYSCDFDYQRILVENFIPVLCIMHEKSCLLKSGLFDESLKRHEDWDLWVRMSRHFRFVHHPKVTCEFTFRTDGSGMTSGTLPTFLKSMRYVYQKYAQEVAGDHELRQRQKNALMQLNLNIFSFLGERIAPYESLTTLPFHELQQTGATQAQIRSGFHYLQGKKTGDTHEKIILMEKSLAECPDNHQACLDLVSLYLNAGNYSLAVARLNLLEEANPGEKNFAELRALLQEKIAASGSLLAPGKLVQLSPEKALRQGIEVSVVIPVFNQASYTRACLEALFAVTGDGIPYEVIVVDNSSSDWTPEFLMSQVPRIRVISNDRNLGFAKACNQGAQLAKGKYLLFLNNDTVPQPGCLNALLSGIHEEEADIVGAKLLYPNGKVQHAGVAFNRNGIGYHIFKNFDADTPAVNKKRFMQCVTAACMLVSRQLYSELGGFDEQFRNGFEDVDFCLRAGQAGKRILYTPAAVVTHHEEQSEGRKQHDCENMQRYLARWQGFVHSDDEELYTAEGFSVEWHADGNCVVRPRSVQQVIHESSRYPLIPLVGHSSSSILQKLSSSQRLKGVLNRYTTED
ncbi:MAG: glycosyltransferase [Steroidobacteraceae bacterium]|nr:glycosyltransferase [Deltaproteobacteria bacterium]